mmetsp:Transcript_59263/g.144912  ORF Transcript_59263/g.144912 Transcript_59263/m.144912 type:complete len:878 (-) Transcript_59263:4409-7042(-)
MSPNSPSSALIRGVGKKAISWGRGSYHHQDGNGNGDDNAAGGGDLESGETTALLITSLGIKDNGDVFSSDATDRQDNTTNIITVVLLDKEMADLVCEMFNEGGGRLIGGTSESKFDEGITQHPKTNPKLPPTLRYKRHRNYYIFELNQFRHWWKTSRLLVRLSGGYEYCLSTLHWTAMGLYNVNKRKQGKHALKAMKTIGRGGVSKDFLKHVKPFTRSIRIVLAVARGWEARVDNRMFEVLIAEAFAFMGNRCSRFIARKSVDGSTAKLLFPLSAKYFAPYLDQSSRPVIVTMGFIRAILPFMFSFQGSRIGRQLTFNTWKYALHQWQPVQSIMDFNPHASVYQDLELDESLVRMAHRIAAAVGHGTDPIETRTNLLKIGFDVFAIGFGGQAIYRRFGEQSPKVLILTITPYGPSVMDELPRYMILERKWLKAADAGAASKGAGKLSPKSVFINASKQPDAAICGFLYSNAFFNPQEWAALSSRYLGTLDAYDRSCKVLNTAGAVRRGSKIVGPPKDLTSLKDFIRSGNVPKKRRKDAKRWTRIEKEVQKVASTVKRYQTSGTAPKQVIIYLEGLDCSAKSSTGGLVCKALEESGYAVRTAQHNRPPTAEQRQKGWMDRSRFQYPCDMWKGEEVPEYTAVVWDRGPAGDFVYGSYRKLSPEAKFEKYQEFVTFDEECRSDGVLFLKLLFVADKDSIALTLGKRLAQKSIAKDLQTWLDANSTMHKRDGLAEIENHIDPTDFIAFNNYKTNISIFTEFALNTNSLDIDGNDQYNNPWTVINTCKRYPARLQLLKTFERQLQRYAETPKDRATVIGKLYGTMDPRRPSIRDVVVPSTYVPYRQKGIALRAVIQTFILAALLYFYAYITWNFDLHDYIEE